MDWLNLRRYFDGMNARRFLTILFFVILCTSPARAEEKPSRVEVIAALNKATKYFHGTIAAHGGYAWTSSVDGKFRHGEGAAGPGTIWIQPPGTPAVGLAFLDAHEATDEPLHLKAAEDTAMALVKGQLRSGGWHYQVEFDSEKRKAFTYRDHERDRLGTHAKTPAPGGWDIWKQRRFKSDMTLLDDDTTPAALRLLMRVDKALKFKNKDIHDTVEYALISTLKAQYPIGAWSHNYDRFPTESPAESHYPIKQASYPAQWSRTWTKDFTGCYMLNDRITQNMIATMLLAHRIYGDKRYLESAHRGGKFLLLAQMPDPQPAWALEYNRDMQSVWDRKFEPPAITGLESQDVLETLLHLYRETGERAYLEPIPKATAYFKKSTLADGSLSRFYELKTNKPLFFTKDYRLTYDKDQVPTHYRFSDPSRLDAIEKEYRRLLDTKPEDVRKELPVTWDKDRIEAVRKVLVTQDAKGAWTEAGMVRDHGGKKLTPKEGVVPSQTFIDHTATLIRYLKGSP